MKPLKLFMLLLGCKPPGRNTEQHDIFFGIGTELKELLPDIFDFWPEANQKIHIDAWREVNRVDNFDVGVVNREEINANTHEELVRLFFINLGGYKPGEFEEFHYKLIVAAPNKGIAIQQAKKTAFYRHTGFKGATSHVDDKYGVDVDDLYEISDILPATMKEKYSIKLMPATTSTEDQLVLGYTRLDKL
ncbi:DUF1543 domain-containing protein [Terrimonas alba]|uniref:DUF1543 domain-containing protein n=1 Tax=Terrimonas alba TaxID=3349636 RepID=UPI0035F3C509